MENTFWWKYIFHYAFCGKPIFFQSRKNSFFVEKTSNFASSQHQIVKKWKRKTELVGESNLCAAFRRLFHAIIANKLYPEIPKTTAWLNGHSDFCISYNKLSLWSKKIYNCQNSFPAIRVCLTNELKFLKLRFFSADQFQVHKRSVWKYQRPEKTELFSTLFEFLIH